MVESFSEIGGTFPSNNWVSNESAFQTVVPRLRATVKPGGVYVGVGPDQNFTYIAALDPAIAFVVDIRRQNLLHHLLYKALFELAPDRESFLALLFSRPALRPRPPPPDTSIEALLADIAERPTDPANFDGNARKVIERLKQTHGFPLTPQDEQTIRSVYGVFYEFGPDITYAPVPGRIGSLDGRIRVLTPFPSYGDLMSERDLEGINWAYLASDEAFHRVRSMQVRNLIVPVVGDFAGAQALRAVGDWVRERQAAITALYTSNVEQYLFQNDVWRVYYDNVATLPLNETSTFIRAFFPSGAMMASARLIITPDGRVRAVDPPNRVNGSRFIESASLLDPVQGLLGAVDAGQVATYLDVIARSR
jgi:hypothetical protein